MRALRIGGILVGLGLVGATLLIGGVIAYLTVIVPMQLDAAQADLTALLRHDLPPQATIRQTIRFLHSSAMNTFAHGHALHGPHVSPPQSAAQFNQEVDLEEFKSHLRNGMVLEASLTGDTDATAVYVTFYFDAQGHLRRDDVGWGQRTL